MSSAEHDPIFLPARTVPAPTTISDEARATLAKGSPLTAIVLGQNEPDPSDKEAWARLLDERERLVEPLLAGAVERFPCSKRIHALAAADLFELVPDDAWSGAEHVAMLYLHPGSYTSCRGVNAANMALPFAGKLGLRTFALDYRLPPQHPFPSALDDALEAYAFLVERFGGKNVIVAGRSAGGGLAAALLLKARDSGIAMPAVAILQTPEADLTESGDTFETNLGLDNFLRRLTKSIALYADGHELTDPYLSPLFGRYDAGFPPIILTSGTRDLFLSNTVLLHRKLRNAGVDAELHVWEAMGHGGFFGAAPEDQDVWNELRRFLGKHLDI